MLNGSPIEGFIHSPNLSEIFKGIALFTPGGDLVYCIDRSKQSRWHLQLCSVFQEVLGLSEPPHFLVPCYAATFDRWLDPKTQTCRTVAEAAPFVLRHQALLNVLFGEALTWHPADTEEVCDLAVISTYQKQFPQLWEDHDLVIRYEKVEPMPPEPGRITAAWSPMIPEVSPQGYVLRLFVAGSGSGTERILRKLHNLLDKSLHQPYTLKVIDVQKHPDLAEADQVTATPTLMRVWPVPIKRIVGELDDAQTILRILTADR
ncbi:MAG: circadian clock KaiB family protein [Timaviella obliquedivisa GSE-PSE-MK23-08B]|jgi:circadian clock protein KaiB|nr:circadian clock KaiB family protein [Timaviella obliquedivisa GSE-PSE-MK23-08B]